MVSTGASPIASEVLEFFRAAIGCYVVEGMSTFKKLVKKTLFVRINFIRVKSIVMKPRLYRLLTFTF